MTKGSFFWALDLDIGHSFGIWALAFGIEYCSQLRRAVVYVAPFSESTIVTFQPCGHPGFRYFGLEQGRFIE